MEIGTKVKWEAANKIMQGLFVQVVDNIAEVVCYKMGTGHCHLTVFVEFYKLIEIK